MKLEADGETDRVFTGKKLERKGQGTDGSRMCLSSSSPCLEYIV